MNSGGVIAMTMTITILTALLGATVATFLTWLHTRQAPIAIVAGGSAFIAVTTLLVQIFTSVGPLNQ